MKKIYTSIVFVAVLILTYACCGDYTYKSDLTEIKYENYYSIGDSSQSVTIMVEFFIKNKFTEISSINFIPEAKADGTICSNHLYYQKYSDPITEINLYCDKDFKGVKANGNLAHLVSAFVNTSHIKSQSCDQYVTFLNGELNNVYSINGLNGNIPFQLVIPKIDFPQSGDYKFKLQIKTQSGKVFEAESTNITI